MNNKDNSKLRTKLRFATLRSKLVLIACLVGAFCTVPAMKLVTDDLVSIVFLHFFISLFLSWVVAATVDDSADLGIRYGRMVTAQHDEHDERCHRAFIALVSREIMAELLYRNRERWDPAHPVKALALRSVPPAAIAGVAENYWLDHHGDAILHLRAARDGTHTKELAALGSSLLDSIHGVIDRGSEYD